MTHFNRKGKSIIFSAPSGAGKTTIVHYLLSQIKELEFSISACSREARGNEVNGKDYYFIGVEGFKEKIKNDEFVEWEEVYKDNFYGTLTSELARVWEKDKVVIFDVDVIGGLNLKEKLGKDALSIFVQPPSIEALKERLRSRSTETEEKINTRINKAEFELSFKDQFDYVLLNDELDRACKEIVNVVKEFIQS